MCTSEHETQDRNQPLGLLQGSSWTKVPREGSRSKGRKQCFPAPAVDNCGVMDNAPASVTRAETPTSQLAHLTS